jgi:hypothetical protein
MDLTIHLSPEEGARLAAAARREGLDPAEWVKRSVLERFPLTSEGVEQKLDTKLRERQARDGSPLSTHVPAGEPSPSGTRKTPG